MIPEVTTPPQHSKRVQAWVYAIMNPVIEGLRREDFYLAKGNITWQSDTKRCEYIRPICEYIQYSQRPNYEDFMADPLNLGFKEKFEEHDRGLCAVELRATEFTDGLIHSDLFQKQVKDLLERYQSMARDNPQCPYLEDSTGGGLARGVAALIVNRITAQPHHYVTHRFWELYKNEFESYHEGPSFQPVKKAAEALKGVSNKLLLDLEDQRQSLCRTYDIPAAPITADTSHSFDAFIV